jgi:hypothetical protein
MNRRLGSGVSYESSFWSYGSTLQIPRFPTAVSYGPHGCFLRSIRPIPTVPGLISDKRGVPVRHELVASGVPAAGLLLTSGHSTVSSESAMSAIDSAPAVPPQRTGQKFGARAGQRPRCGNAFSCYLPRCGSDAIRAES